MTTSTAKHRAAKAAKARARRKDYERKRNKEPRSLHLRHRRRTSLANRIELATGHRPVKWHPYAAGVVGFVDGYAEKCRMLGASPVRS